MTVGVVSEGSTLVCETPMEFARVIPCPVHYLFNAMGNLVQSVVGVICLHIIINISVKGGPLMKTSYFGTLFAFLTVGVVGAIVGGIARLLGKRRDELA